VTRAELRALRAEIDRIDGEIVSLAAKRKRVAHEIGLVKIKDGIEVRDKRREAVVADETERRARRLGLSKGTGKAIAKALVSDAVAVQRKTAPRPLDGRKALVVGGSGKMGEWTCRFLSCRGADVSVWDPRGRLQGYANVKRPEDAAADADIIVV
jgi:chorismate mutase